MQNALRSQDDWDTFRSFVKADVSKNRTLYRTTATTHRYIGRPLVLHAQGVPVGNGPIEEKVDILREWLSGRTNTLGNLQRSNLLLDLMRLGLNNRADEQLFIERIRQDLVHRHGEPEKVRAIAFVKGNPDF